MSTKKPLDPATLSGALQDTVHKEVGNSRPAKSYKVYRIDEMPPASRLKPPRRRSKPGRWFNPQEKWEYNDDPILHTRWPSKMDDLDHTIERIPTLDAEKLKSILPTNGKYSPEQRIMAASVLAVSGSAFRAARMAGIPNGIMTSWRKTPWFKEITQQVMRLKSEEYDAKATKIIHTLLEEIEDRVENGDEVIVKNKDGYEKVRKKASMKDCAVVQSILFDKRALGRGDPTSRVEKRDAGNLLADLKKSFEDAVKEKDVVGERIT